MADFSSITITFNADLVKDDSIVFEYGFGQVITETWIEARATKNQVSIGSAIPGSDGERSAINFSEAIKADYGFLPISVSRNLNVVTIVSQDPQIEFSWTSAPAEVAQSISNDTEDVLIIESVGYLAATINPVSSHVKLNITTSILADEIYKPEVITGNSDNPFSVEVLRGIPYSISVESSSGQTFEKTYLPIPVINEASIEVLIESTPDSANVTVVVGNDLQDDSVLSLEYSLDNINWQSSNEFPGLAFGSQTMYVRDQFGATASVTFQPNEENVNVPYVYVPKTNSIRYANRITFGDCANYKNVDNTLSCESDVKKPFKEVQQFQSCDVITTQFRSNYEDQVARVLVLNNDGSQTPHVQSVVQKSSNIGIKDRRDARKYNLDNGQTGIYFLSGNIYNYTSGADIGDYVLNGALPEWGEIGNYLFLGDGMGGGTWHVIRDIIYDEEKSAEVLVINLTYTGSDTWANVRSLYNREAFEIYEFTVDMVDFLNKRIQVEIQNNDSYFDNTTHLSEVIEVKIRHEQTMEIQYWNKNNTDIDFSTGIRHKIRIPWEGKKSGPKDETSIHVTDTDVVLLSTEIQERDEFEFQPVTEAFMWLMVRALSHTNVTLNGVDYVKDGASISVDGPLEDTNLYIVTAGMLKARDIYGSDSGVGSFNAGDIEIPNLIGGGNDFVQYQ